VRIAKEDAYLAGTLCLALVTRLIGITARPLWYDEAFAVLFAQTGPSEMIRGTLALSRGVAADVHPLLYYTLLWGWMQIFGESSQSVRGFSIIVGLMLFGLVYILSRAILGKRVALISALIFALSPFQIHYAQEVRMYVLLASFLIGATVALWKGMQTDKWYWWVLFAVGTAFAQLTHNLAVFYLLPLAITPLLFRQWKAFGRVVLVSSVAVVLYLPWLIQIPSQFAKVQQSYWITRPSVAQLIATLLSFVTNLPLPEDWLPFAIFVALFVIILASWKTILARSRQYLFADRGIWLFYMSFAPMVVLFLFSQWQPVFIERALLPSAAVFAIWLGWALGNTEYPRSVQAFTFLLLFIGSVIGIYQHITYRGFPYGPFKEIDAHLAANIRSGEIILHSNKLTMLPAVYYDPDLPHRYISDPPGSGADTLALPTQEVLGLVAYPSVQSATVDAKRIWFLIFARAIDEYRSLGMATHPDLAWLESHYQLEKVENWEDILIYEFVQ
jgi:mannosyltransferase